MIANLLPVAGGLVQVDLAADDSSRLVELQKMVGGDIEVVPLSGQRFMVINENGKLATHARNEMATDLAHAAEAIDRFDYIAGPAVIIPQSALS